MTEEFEDRYLALHLEEELGGVESPDLAGRVQFGLAREHGRSRRQNPRRLIYVAAAVVVSGIVGWLARPVATGREPQLAITVERGSFEWTSGATTTRLVAGESWTVPLRHGDRLATVGSESTALELFALGKLELSRDCLLEIEAMEWKPFGGGFVAGGVVVAVAAGIATWSSGDLSEVASAGERLALRSGGDATTSIEAVLAEKAALSRELEAAQGRIAELEATAARNRVVDPVAGPAALDESEAAPLRFTYAEYATALERIDWKVCGKAVVEMTPQLAALVESLVTEGDVSLEAMADIQKANSNLLREAQHLTEGIPGIGVNGAFTHPTVTANLVDASLSAAGLELDETQRLGLENLTTRFSQEDDQRRANYGGDEIGLPQLLEETDLRERFYREVDSLLTPEQLAVIRQEGSAGRIGADLFSSGLEWAQFVRPAPIADRDSLQKMWGDRLTGSLGLEGERAERVEKIVESWAKSTPDSYFDSSDAASQLNMFRLDQVRGAAQRQLALYEQIARELQMSPEQRQRLFRNLEVFVPAR